MESHGLDGDNRFYLVLAVSRKRGLGTHTGTRTWGGIVCFIPLFQQMKMLRNPNNNRWEESSTSITFLNQGTASLVSVPAQLCGMTRHNQPVGAAGRVGG